MRFGHLQIKLARILSTAGNMIGRQQKQLDIPYDLAVRRRDLAMVHDPGHPLLSKLLSSHFPLAAILEFPCLQETYIRDCLSEAISTSSSKLGELYETYLYYVLIMIYVCLCVLCLD